MSPFAQADSAAVQQSQRARCDAKHSASRME